MKRRLACSDLHGNGELWDKIKDFLQPGDILFMLGDAGDRGRRHRLFRLAGFVDQPAQHEKAQRLFPDGFVGHWHPSGRRSADFLLL